MYKSVLINVPNILHYTVSINSYLRNMVSDNRIIQTPIQRLRDFVKWAQSQGLCRSEYDFERICCLSPKYISNNANSGKGNIGTEMLGRIIKAFPQLNLTWLCTGDGPMLLQGGEGLNVDYKQAYEGAMMQIEALNRIIKQLNAR